MSRTAVVYVVSLAKGLLLSVVASGLSVGARRGGKTSTFKPQVGLPLFSKADRCLYQLGMSNVIDQAARHSIALQVFDLD